MRAARLRRGLDPSEVLAPSSEFLGGGLDFPDSEPRTWEKLLLRVLLFVFFGPRLL